MTTTDAFEAVAARVGFGSSDSAHRAFRAFHGTSPARYRALHRPSATVESHNLPETTAFPVDPSQT
ncbi:hypothetical protein [Microbacterium sp. XT11]|uniref:hypothetical protein n=1 Tax=Microbacterium sp. XT11 TaxID=367477 RepID=UPI0009FA58B5